MKARLLLLGVVTITTALGVALYGSVQKVREAAARMH
jgi:hypothetical protein